MSNSVESVRGTKVTIYFEAQKCVHSRNCVLGRPDVFVPTERPRMKWPHWPRTVRRGPFAMNVTMASPMSKRPLVNTVRVREAVLLIAAGAETYRATLCRSSRAFATPLRVGWTGGDLVRAALWSQSPILGYLQ